MRVLDLRRTRRVDTRLAGEESKALVDALLPTWDAFRRASGELDLRALTADVFLAEPTAHVARLNRRGADGTGFYERELAPNWEGLSREERAAKLDRFLDLAGMLAGSAPKDADDESLVDMVATVHTKVLLLAWAYDRSYGYVDRVFQANDR